MRHVKTALMAGVAAIIVSAPAMATDNATDKQKQQYLYD